jgi:ABC-type Fe3+ transport system permease subunit
LVRWLALLVLGGIFLGPIAALFSQANSVVFSEVLSSTAFPKALKATLISGGMGAVFSVILGILFANRVALYQWRLQRLQRLLLLLPYFIPNFIQTIIVFTGRTFYKRIRKMIGVS